MKNKHLQYKVFSERFREFYYQNLFSIEKYEWALDTRKKGWQNKYGYYLVRDMNPGKFIKKEINNFYNISMG